MVLTDDPDNSNQHRIVIRTNTHKRARVDNSRFNAPILAKSQKARDIKFEKDDFDNDEYQSNWLGMTWFTKYNNSTPASQAQIEEGLINEAIV